MLLQKPQLQNLQKNTILTTIYHRANLNFVLKNDNGHQVEPILEVPYLNYLLL